MSPVVVRCSECSYILGKEDVELIDLEVLVKDLNGKCPKCGHTLTLPPKTVEVKPYPTRFGEKAAGSSRLNTFKAGMLISPIVSGKTVEVGPAYGSSRRQPSKPR